MAYLALFRIKNGNFPFAAYGLRDNTFSMDITQTLSSQKGVKFTEYPLLDGTTRIDSVSRAPGTLNFQGKIGEVFHSPNSNFSTVMASENETRSKRFIKLLEDIRDAAIVLDIITEAKTFENYLIESVSFNVSQMGILDVNFSMKEFIAFGSEITTINFEPEEYKENVRNEFYLNTLTMRNFATDQEMIDSIYELLTNEDISEPYIIKMGTGDLGFTPDLTINPIPVNKPSLVVTRTKSGFLNSITNVKRTYTPVTVRSRIPSAIYSSGAVIDNLKLKISMPNFNTGSLVNENTIVTENSYGLLDGGDYTYKPDVFNETGKYFFVVEIYEGENIKRTKTLDEVMVTPKYSEVANGINPVQYVHNSFENDLIISTASNASSLRIQKQALSFIKKTSDPKVYQFANNLLGDTSLGYLYAFKYLKELAPNYSVREYRYEYHIGFVYFHPELVKRIVNIINNFNITNGNLLNGKTIKWW